MVIVKNGVVSVPVEKDGKQVNTRYIHKGAKPQEIPDAVAKKLIARGVVEEVKKAPAQEVKADVEKSEPVKAKAVKADKKKQAVKPEVEDELPPGAKSV